MSTSVIKVYPQPGTTYLHYKGGLYEVLHLAKHSETDETLVVYKSIHFGSYHVRPLEIWFEQVTYEHDGVSITRPRFDLFTGYPC